MSEPQREYMYAYTQGNYQEMVWAILTNRRWMCDYTPKEDFFKWVEKSNNQELKNKFINMEGDFNSRMNKLTQEERDQIRLIDLFFELDDKITDQTFLDTENNINLANYGVSFEEKMKFARAKDIFDQQKFNPFSRMRPIDTSNMSLMFQKTPDQYEKELQDILAKAPRDSQGRLLAPNGKPSNLTERQYAQVRTKAFKNWFGDWENDPKNASKVVDENGEPLVVYHGSKNGDLSTFDYKHLRNADSGFFFTSDKEYAKQFGDTRGFFLNIKNPNVTDTPLNIDSVETLLTTNYKRGTDGIQGHDDINTNENYLIKKVGTEEVYSEAIDVESSNFEYIETEEKTEEKIEEEIERAE